MWPVAIVVSGELGQHRVQVALIDHDQMIEALGTNRPDDPLGNRVGLRRPGRCPHASDRQARQPAVEVTAIDGVAVVDEETWPSASRSGLKELVPDPGGGRTAGDVEVDEFPPLVADKE